MTSNPYTPDEAELAHCYAGAMEEQAGENYDQAKTDAERGIAKIRAEAWDEGVRAQCATYDMRPDAGRNPYRQEEAND